MSDHHLSKRRFRSGIDKINFQRFDDGEAKSTYAKEEEAEENDIYESSSEYEDGPRKKPNYFRKTRRISPYSLPQSTASYSTVPAQTDDSSHSRKRGRPRKIINAHGAPPDWYPIWTLVRAFRGTERGRAEIDKSGAHCLNNVRDTMVDREFQTLVSLLLSSQTRDECTAVAVKNLCTELPGGLTVESVCRTSEDDLNKLIKGVGFYNRKTKYMKQCARIIKEQFHGRLPDSLKAIDLAKTLPGVGMKMAQLYVQICFHRSDGISSDTHVTRITQKWGWAPAKVTPDLTSRYIEAWLPQDIEDTNAFGEWGIPLGGSIDTSGSVISHHIPPHHGRRTISGSAQQHRLSMQRIHGQSHQAGLSGSGIAIPSISHTGFPQPLNPSVFGFPSLSYHMPLSGQSMGSSSLPDGLSQAALMSSQGMSASQLGRPDLLGGSSLPAGMPPMIPSSLDAMHGLQGIPVPPPVPRVRSSSGSASSHGIPSIPPPTLSMDVGSSSIPNPAILCSMMQHGTIPQHMMAGFGIEGSIGTVSFPSSIPNASIPEMAGIPAQKETMESGIPKQSMINGDRRQQYIHPPAVPKTESSPGMIPKLSQEPPSKVGGSPDPLKDLPGSLSIPTILPMDRVPRHPSTLPLSPNNSQVPVNPPRLPSMGTTSDASPSESSTRGLASSHAVHISPPSPTIQSPSSLSSGPVSQGTSSLSQPVTRAVYDEPFTSPSLDGGVCINRWTIINGMVVGFGQSLCHAKHPLCAECPVNAAGLCPATEVLVESRMKRRDEFFTKWRTNNKKAVEWALRWRADLSTPSLSTVLGATALDVGQVKKETAIQAAGVQLKPEKMKTEIRKVMPVALPKNGE
eukprot:gnl/Carplike_NY0171/2127_a2861_439.p1 GENE.gnl/Carplike_NY0171/2127_a2861_439~~gnl/Carplike_NY0171/2127_a2861_439.p1  ORF type:complete len:850 (-),score=220.74 gnl/Carplike_NY0171/2127_a2861_439:246-2795(-)